MMRKMILWIMICMLYTDLFAQKTQVFALSPLAKDIQKVNGMVVGLGHFDKKGDTKQINGINVDLNVLSPMIVFMATMYGTDLKQNHTETIVIVKGLNVGIGGYMGSVVHQGVNFSMYNLGRSMQGLSFNATYNSVDDFKGVSFAGLGNFNDNSTGLVVAPLNFSQQMKGVQIGVYNKSLHVTGMQIGLINITDRMNGLQIGLFNKNSKRVLPFINF